MELCRLFTACKSLERFFVVGGTDHDDDDDFNSINIYFITGQYEKDRALKHTDSRLNYTRYAMRSEKESQQKRLYRGEVVRKLAFAVYSPRLAQRGRMYSETPLINPQSMFTFYDI